MEYFIDKKSDYLPQVQLNLFIDELNHLLNGEPSNFEQFNTEVFPVLRIKDIIAEIKKNNGDAAEFRQFKTDYFPSTGLNDLLEEFQTILDELAVPAE